MGAISFRANATSGADASSYTFSAIDIGAATSDRYVIVGITAGGASGAATITSVTVDGVSATVVVQYQSGTVGEAALAIAKVGTSSGHTTGDVVVTFNTGVVRCGVGIWAATGLNSPTPRNTATSGANPLAVSVNTLPGDVGIACAYGNNGTGATWSGATVRYDAADADSAGHSGADFTTTLSQTPRTVTNTWSSPGLDAAVAASFSADTLMPQSVM